jgi:hypothetical protein
MNKQTKLQKIKAGESQLELDLQTSAAPFIQSLAVSSQSGLLSRNGSIHFSTYQLINSEVEQ